ncbi:MAG: type I restriction enzyme HsdR N-terminal domain-containing protein [Caldilineaceae bacterium]|nr:type I restriction enzyme HsdR N-terminal domain-containing protein [Caldilineaceae bacterium]
MLLEPLTDVLALVRDRIKNFEREFTNNETQTRLSLVDPVLKALGWDPQDPTMVKVEYPVHQRNRNSTRVDYALLDSTREPIAFVEAKNLGNDLRDAHLQLFEYAVGKSVPYVIATNGAAWNVYKKENEATRVSIDVLLEVSLLDQSPTLAAIKLLSLWKGLLTSQTSIDQIAPALDDLDAVTSTNGKDPVPPPPNGDSRSTESLFTAPDAVANGLKLHELILPDKTKVECRTFSSMLTSIVAWLHRTNRLNVELPWNPNVTSYRAVLNSVPYHPNMNPMKSPKKIYNKLYLDTNHDRYDLCKFSTALLEQCGQNPRLVRVLLARIH